MGAYENDMVAEGKADQTPVKAYTISPEAMKNLMAKVDAADAAYSQALKDLNDARLQIDFLRVLGCGAYQDLIRADAQKFLDRMEATYGKTTYTPYTPA